MYAPGPRELQTNGVEAGTFEALADIAIEQLRTQQGSNIGMVCGPITTGGTNNQTYNFEIFNATIRGLQNSGVSLFDQVPYEFGLRKLAYQWEAAGNTGYCTPILTVFYARLFESSLIKRGWFIPGWRSSFGAQWEREKLRTNGAMVIDLTREEIRRFLRQEYPAEHVGRIMSLLP